MSETRKIIEVCTLIQTAEKLNVSVRTLRAWIRQGKITAKKYANGGKLYITAEEIARLQSQME